MRIRNFFSANSSWCWKSLSISIFLMGLMQDKKKLLLIETTGTKKKKILQIAGDAWKRAASVFLQWNCGKPTRIFVIKTTGAKKNSEISANCRRCLKTRSICVSAMELRQTNKNFRYKNDGSQKKFWNFCKLQAMLENAQHLCFCNGTAAKELSSFIGNSRDRKGKL